MWVDFRGSCDIGQNHSSSALIWVRSCAKFIALLEPRACGISSSAAPSAVYFQITIIIQSFFQVITQGLHEFMPFHTHTDSVYLLFNSPHPLHPAICILCNKEQIQSRLHLRRLMKYYVTNNTNITFSKKIKKRENLFLAVTKEERANLYINKAWKCLSCKTGPTNICAHRWPWIYMFICYWCLTVASSHQRQIFEMGCVCAV